MKIIKNGTLVNSQETYIADIAIQDEKIVKIGSHLEVTAQDEVYDATGCFVFPGFIDTHTHLDMDAGATHTADNFKTGTRAAVVSGTTTIIDFATQDKGHSLQEAYDAWRKLADHQSSCNYRFHMAITDWNEQTKAEVAHMPSLGVTSFKVYMAYDNLKCNDGEILECLQEVKKIDGLLGVHCENGTLVDELIHECIENKQFTPHYHPLSRPSDVEAEAINRLAYIGKLVGHPVHVVHLSSKKGLEEVRHMRALGQPITVETCPQYLVLDDSKYDLPNFEGAKYVMSPPLRKKEDNLALMEAIAQGEIETIGTDHCSFNFKGQKELGRENFAKIPNGAPGVEHRPQLIYTYLVDQKWISVSKMCELMCENPAKLYGMFPKKGILQEGSEADIVVFDPRVTSVIQAKQQLQNVDYTPYEGMEVKGQATYVFLNGQCVVQSGRVTQENQGTYVY